MSNELPKIPRADFTGGGDPIEAARRVDSSEEVYTPRFPRSATAQQELEKQVAELNTQVDELQARLAAIKAVVATNLGVWASAQSNTEDVVRVAVALAQRAILVGLTTDFPPDVVMRMGMAVEIHRVDHLTSLLRGQAPRSGLEHVLSIAVDAD